MAFTGKWRLIIKKNLNPFRVHVIWHALALSMTETPKSNTILLTTTNKSSVSCGYHQNFYEEVDIEYCKKNNIELVRRMAGGGLVLLDKDQVFYNVLINGFGFPSSIKKLYAISLKGPNQFLRNLNLNSQIAYNEIVVNNRKISGTGAASIGNVGVVVGNIILDFDYKRFCETLNVPNNQFRELLIRELENYLTTLKLEINDTLSIDETINGLKSAFETTFQNEIYEEDLEDSEAEIIKDREDKYKEFEWNFRDRDEKFGVRSFIKIKKGTFIMHYPRFNAELLVADKIIKKIKAPHQNHPLQPLIDHNIFEIENSFPKFKDLQDILIAGFERSNV